VPTSVDADYHVRIFTPQDELPFAGHPTVGTAHAVLEAGLVRRRDGRLRQQCPAGVLQLTIVGEGPERRISVEAPAATFTPLGATHLQQLEGALGARIVSTAAPAVVNVGAQWLVAELADASAVRALTPDMAAVTALTLALGRTIGVTVFGRCREADHTIVTRSFAPAEGIPEDPVCGSGNASVGAFMHRAGVLPAREYVASQLRACALAPEQPDDSTVSPCVALCCRLPAVVAAEGQQKGNASRAGHLLIYSTSSRQQSHRRSGSNRGRATSGTCSCGEASLNRPGFPDISITTDVVR
jgi:predicted PhzF superfamily epimerase YddE/YHI9